MNYTEHAHTIAGVAGRMFARHAWPDSTSPERARGLFSSQTWGASRAISEGRTISVNLRFDDNCKNGHHTFAITGEIRDPKHGNRRDNYVVTAGCIHEEIAKHFPELAHLIKWHLTSADGPMHYVANTVYLAGDRDHWGLRKGETRQLRNGKTGLPCWELVLTDSDGTQRTHIHEWRDSETCPTDAPRAEWRPRLIVGEGKERQLDAARSVAV